MRNPLERLVMLRTLLVHLHRLIRLRLAAAGVNLVSRVLNNLAKLSDFAASPAVVVHVSGNPSGCAAREDASLITFVLPCCQRGWAGGGGTSCHGHCVLRESRPGSVSLRRGEMCCSRRRRPAVQVWIGTATESAQPRDRRGT